MNPDTIGISIVENGKVLLVQEYSLKIIFDKVINSKLSSNSPKMKYYQNKLKFETFEITKSITKLAKHYNCKNVFIEKISFGVGVTQKYNNIGNRKTKNLWKRLLFVSNLKKRLNIENINLFEVHPAYSSFIGNLQHNFTDAINASLEIGRRGYETKILKIKDSFYPKIKLKKSILHLWKEKEIEIVDSWKNLFLSTKNSKLKYRVSLEDVKTDFKVFSLNQSNRSNIKIYMFNYLIIDLCILKINLN